MKGYFGNLEPKNGNNVCIYFVTDGTLSIGDLSLPKGNGVIFTESANGVFNGLGLTIMGDHRELEGALRATFGTCEDRVFSFDQTDKFISDCRHFFNSSECEYTNEAYADGVIRMLLSYVTSDSKLNETYDSTIKKHVIFAENYIKSNIDKRIRMDELASMMGVTRAYLRNIFYEINGMSPQEFLSHIRIKKAMELLSETNMGISEIASSVGYSDSLAFSKFFKAHVGVSPKNYRFGNVEEAPAKIADSIVTVEEKTYDNNIKVLEKDIDITSEIEKAIARAAQAEKEREENENSILNSPVWLL